MVRATRICLACLVCLVLAASVKAQGPIPPPPVPAPIWAPGTPVLPQNIPVPGQPQPAPPPPPPLNPPPVFPPAPIQFPGDEAAIFRPEQKGGIFAAFELGLFASAIGGNLAAPVSVGGVTKNVSLPLTDLDWTGSPRLELGYRFADGIGAAVADYRSLVSQGTENLDNYGHLGPAFVRTRLNLNSVDLGYASPDIKIDPLWDVKWDAGVRIGAVYYDSQESGHFLQRHVTNNFVGAGPRAGVDVRRYLEAAPGFSAFGRLETGVLFGGDTQSYEETLQLPNHTLVSGGTRFSSGESVPMFGMQLGLSYSPPQNPQWLRFSFGYQYERWWNVGGAGGNSGDVQFQGLFFRGEFHY